MYNNDIKVTIEEAFEPSVGLINRALLVTHEAAIPFTKLSGANAVTELEKYLTDNSLTVKYFSNSVRANVK